MPIIRPYRPADLPALRDICVRTAHAGGDSRPVSVDHDLVADIFAEPYVVAEPELAFVVDDGGSTVGYIVGTADTAAFVRWFRAEWLPRVGPRHPLPAGRGSEWDEMMTGLLYRPERMLVDQLAGYPAHLHIDLLPGYQRQGLGRRLMTALLAALHERGVPAVHLGMAVENTGARVFYDRCGFTEIDVPEAVAVVYLGRSTAP